MVKKGRYHVCYPTRKNGQFIIKVKRMCGVHSNIAR